MPSKTYPLIWKAARSRQQVACTYRGLPREFCPIVLGYAADGSERLLAYQFGGKTSGGSKLPGWRCFDVPELQDVQLRRGKWFEGGSHKQAQKYVDFVDVDVNIPETLTHKRPLPFGSPDLRPPRGASRDASHPVAANVVPLNPTEAMAAAGRKAVSALSETLRRNYKPGAYVVLALREEHGLVSGSADHVAAGGDLLEAVRKFRKQFPGTAGYVHRVGEEPERFDKPTRRTDRPPRASDRRR